MFKLLLNTWSIRLKERLTEWSPQAGCFICPQTRAHSPPMLAFTTPLWFFFPCPACASSKFKLQECSCPLFIEKLLRDWGRPFWEGCVCGGRMASCRAGGCHCPQGSAGHARSTGSGICLHAQGWRRWDGGCHRSGQQHLSCWQPLPCRVLTPAGADPNPRPQKQDCMRAEFSSDSRQNKNKLKKKKLKKPHLKKVKSCKKTAEFRVSLLSHSRSPNEQSHRSGVRCMGCCCDTSQTGMVHFHAQLGYLFGCFRQEWWLFCTVCLPVINL